MATGEYLQVAGCSQAAQDRLKHLTYHVFVNVYACVSKTLTSGVNARLAFGSVEYQIGHVGSSFWSV